MYLENAPQSDKPSKNRPPRSESNSAVFPEPVAPLTRLNSPIGKLRFRGPSLKGVCWRPRGFAFQAKIAFSNPIPVSLFAGSGAPGPSRGGCADVEGINLPSAVPPFSDEARSGTLKLLSYTDPRRESESVSEISQRTCANDECGMGGNVVEAHIVQMVDRQSRIFAL